MLISIHTDREYVLYTKQMRRGGRGSVYPRPAMVLCFNGVTVIILLFILLYYYADKRLRARVFRPNTESDKRIRPSSARGLRTNAKKNLEKSRAGSSGTRNWVVIIIIIIVAATLKFRVGISLRLQAERVLSSDRHNYNSMKNHVLFPRRSRRKKKKNTKKTRFELRLAFSSVSTPKLAKIKLEGNVRRKTKMPKINIYVVAQPIYPISFIPLNRESHLSLWSVSRDFYH